MLGACLLCQEQLLFMLLGEELFPIDFAKLLFSDRKVFVLGTSALLSEISFISWGAT